MENSWNTKIMYMVYKQCSKVGHVSCMHGNASVKRPGPHTMHAKGCIAAIVRMQVNAMPYQMKCIGTIAETLRGYYQVLRIGSR